MTNIKNTVVERRPHLRYSLPTPLRLLLVRCFLSIGALTILPSSTPMYLEMDLDSHLFILISTQPPVLLILPSCQRELHKIQIYYLGQNN